MDKNNHMRSLKYTTYKIEQIDKYTEYLKEWNLFQVLVWNFEYFKTLNTNVLFITTTRNKT